MKRLELTDAELAGVLKKWADEYAPPLPARSRLLRLARHLTASAHPPSLRMVLFQPFVPLEWSRFTFNWETTQIFQLGLPWNRHIA